MKKKHLMAALAAFITLTFSSCNFWTSLQDPEDQIKITGLSLGKTSLKTTKGSMEYISVTVKPSDVQKDVKLEWSFDASVIECDTSSSWGVTIKALSQGQTTLRCSYGGYDASCLVTVEGVSETFEAVTDPYIYSNYSVLQTTPGISEKVFVSLYGGDASDVDGYSWTIDNPSVASIQETGQYCMITAKTTGYARIRISHKKAAYPYYIGVYVFDDSTQVGYITTANNIVTMNQKDGDKNISVSLMNAKDTSNAGAFSWELIKEEGSEIPLKLSANGDNAVLTPLAGGSCTVRVTHPDSVYPLDILCRVITIVENVYIETDKTVAVLSGEDTQTITSNLNGLKEGEYDMSAYSYSLDNEDAAQIVSSIGNQVTVKGKANGSAKLVISHPKAAYKKEVLLIVNGQLKDAVDASVFITTSQNYIRTKEGASETELNISLKGGEEGDEKDFTWSVKSTASDGSTSDVIKLRTTNGSVMVSRAAAVTYSYGSAWIEPLKEGTAVITVTHPKAVYPTEIMVKVLSKDAVLEDPLYFAGSGLVKLLNGATATYSVELKGESKKASDDSAIKWSIDNSALSVSATGNQAVITAPALGTGETKSYMTVTHPKADCDKTVLVMTADDQASLDAMKALYSDKLYYNITKGTSETCRVYAAGFNEDESAYDFSTVTWTVKDPSVIAIEKLANNPFACRFTGLKSGNTELIVSFEGVNCTFKITVYPEGAEALSPECYLTTNQNVIVLGEPGLTSNAYIGAVNIAQSSYSNIRWTSENTSVATVIGNGVNGTITAVSEGETVISVTHPDSENTLKIYVRVGSEYVMPETDPLVYISTEDVITMLRDDSPHQLNAVLVNYSGEDSSGFTFTSDNPKVASISAQSLNGTCFVKPVGSGQCQITVCHPATQLNKSVLVVVGNSSEELSGFTYLTTGNNVVAIGEGNTKSVSVSVKNSESPVIDGYVWSSSNPNIAGVTSTGSTAVITGNSIGTAFVTVTNSCCKYPLSIIVQVVDPIAASKNPYIQLSSSVINVPVANSYTSVTADLIGGSDEDRSGFVWSVNDPSICSIYGQNEVGKIKGLGAGQTYITVTHPKASYSAQLLVICDEETKKDCYITVPSSIMSLKPNASSQTVTASLVNGTTTDKYNFSWSLDVYDVIDFQYSANVCTITPKQTGSVTITISHPKAAYDQQIIVNVQEYTEFAFPSDSVTVTQGTVAFQTMQVPVTSLTTHVEYSVDDPSICTITGTKAVAQLTACGNGTTRVRAKLIASSTGVEQAKAEMLVYVKPAQTNAVYITSASTILTVNKGKSQTLAATLTGSGITNDDQYNLKWTTRDSDIVQITGISSDGSKKGQSIYVTALKAGEALITCTHEKAQSALQFYVVVPGSAEKSVMLNKTYVTMTKGSSGSQVKATIENPESNSDYNTLEWDAAKVNGHEIVRVMGSGQTVTLYPVEVGETTVMVSLPSNGKTAKCTVRVEADRSFTFETSAKKVQPFHSKTVKYTVSPPDAALTWTTSQDDDYFSFTDMGCDKDGNGKVEIHGLKEGSGSLVCVTNGNAKATLSIKVGWDYKFTTDSKSVSGGPNKTYSVGFTVSPEDATVTVSSSSIANFSMSRETHVVDGVTEYTGKGTITVTPKAEGSESVSIRATNKDTGETIGNATLSMSFVYPTIGIHASLVGKEGRFSHYDGTNNVLYIGDGEKVTLSFYVDQNVSWTMSSSSLDKRVSSSANSKLTNGIANQIVIQNTNDVITQEYLIPTWYVPMGVREVTTTKQGQNGPEVTVTYEEVDKQLDPKTDFSWEENDVGFMDFNADWYLSPSRYWKKEIPSKANSRISISEYQSTPWYWRPAHDAFYHWNGKVAAGPWDAGQTGNQPAQLVNTSSTTIVSSVSTDILTVNITHCGKTQKFQINVVTETRNCPRY